MTREDVIRMAREAGVLSGYDSDLFQRFAALVAAHERPWVGLTDADVNALQDFAYANDVEFIRHIEAALKEKNT